MVAEPFILHKKSLRLLVVNAVVAAAIPLTQVPGQFKTNMHQKGISNAFKPDKKIAEAVRSGRACCLGITGVDMMMTKDRGPVVIEVNYSPGFRGAISPNVWPAAM